MSDAPRAMAAPGRAPILAGPAPHETGTAESAQRLIELVRDCVGSGIARRALLLRLSLLSEDRGTLHHRRLAREALDPLAAADRARLFRLPSGDLVMVWRGGADLKLTSCLDTLHALFADLPAAESITVLLDLPADSERLMRTAEAQPRRREADMVKTRPSRRPFDASIVSGLETALAQASVARFMRHAPVRAVAPPASGQRFTVAWEHRFLSLDELAETLVPDRDPYADPLLLRRLSLTLDRRVLALLAVPGELKAATPFGLDLNVGSIVSPEFLRFDAALPASLRGQVVLGLRAADILADSAAFLFARDFAQARLYRLMLTGTAASQRMVLPLDALGLELLRLDWCAELAAAETMPDADRLVLAAAGADGALAWGRRLGVQFYQGLEVR